MPELPEVETIRAGLKRMLIGHRICSINVRDKKLFIGDPETIKNQAVIEIARRAKILIIRLERSYLLIHLKMTGQLIFVPNGATEQDMVVGGHPDPAYSFSLPHKHTHVIFELDHGKLYFNDLRKFGWIKVVESAEQIEPHVHTLGPEYNWPEFSLEYFTKKLARKKAITVKQLLLDQTIVAGIGNIYADETLFLSKVHPQTKVSELEPNEIQTIFKNIPTIFNKALKHGGTSSQHYRQADGKMGTYLAVANVYKREGMPCTICSTPIERIKIAGRSSHFCPSCQKKR
jgi:formamidopyrimidine-DNA glycosylase